MHKPASTCSHAPRPQDKERRLRRCRQYWTRHNLYLTTLTAMELMVCLIGLCGLVAANAYVLSQTCAWFTYTVFWLYDLSWIIWATMFWLTTVSGARACLVFAGSAMCLAECAACQMPGVALLPS